jgi:hypothetical protein
MRVACAAASAASATGPPLHGVTGTPLSSATRLPPILSPRRRIELPDGPMKTRPASAQASAKSGRSETKPQPGQTASQRASTSREITRGTSR